VVSLPAGIFNPYSGVKTSILLLDKQLAKTTDDILFVKIDNDGYNLGAQRNAVKGGQLDEAIQIIHHFRAGTLSETDMAHAVSKSVIAQNGDYNLSGERYKSVNTLSTNFVSVKLGEICRVINGRAYKQEELLDSGKYPVLRVGNFFSNRGWYYSDLELEPDKYCEKGDLLYAWSASFGPKIWDGAKSIYHYHIWKMEPDETRINKKFLYLVLDRETEAIKAEGGRGIAMIHITKGGIEEREIPLPPLSIQEEIVAEIDGYQKIIDGAKMVVENYKPKIDIDPEWEMVEFEKAPFKIIDGDRGSNYPNGDDFSSEGYCLFLNTKNVRDNGFRFNELLFISKEKDELLRKGKLQREDVLLTTRGTIGNTAYYNDSIPYNNIRINSGMLIFRPDNKKLLSEYLYYFFQSENCETQFSRIVSGAAQPQLPIRSLNSAIIPIPSIEVQNHIVTQIVKELTLVNANKELIAIFEGKIKERIAKVWGGAAPTSPKGDLASAAEEVLLAAEPEVEYGA